MSLREKPSPDISTSGSETMRDPVASAGDEALRRLPVPTSDAGLDKLPHKGSFATGALLAIYGLVRRDVWGLFSAGIGAGLFYHGARRNGLLNGGFARHLFHTRNRRFVRFKRQIIVDRPTAEAYRFWTNLDNLAVFLPHIRDIRPLGEGLSRWQLQPADNVNLEWTAELTEVEANRLIVWRVLEPSDLYHEGWVSFEPLRADKSTRMTIQLDILAPGGQVGAYILDWLKDLPIRYFAEDMQRFRTVLQSDSLEELEEITSETQ